MTVYMDTGNTRSFVSSSDYTTNILRKADDITVPITNDSAIWEASVSVTEIQYRGVNIEITVHNKSGQNQKAPTIRLWNGFYKGPVALNQLWTGYGPDSLTQTQYYWCCDSYGLKNERTYNEPSPYYWGNGLTNSTYPTELRVPFLSSDSTRPNLDGQGNWWFQHVSTVSTNYQYPVKIYGQFDLADSGKAYVIIEGNVDRPGIRNPVDFFAPNETRTWTVWVRFEYIGPENPQPWARQEDNRYRGILRSLEPYINWVASTHDKDPGNRLSGRLYSMPLSGSDGNPNIRGTNTNPRKYYIFDPVLQHIISYPTGRYVQPDTCTGWKELLYAIINPDSLKSKGYVGIILSEIAGYGNNGNGLAAGFFNNMPDNLKNTVHEIKEWETETELQLHLWSGHAFEEIQTGNWNSANEKSDLNFSNSLSYSVSSLQKWNIPQDNLDNIDSNLKNGSMTYASGILFDNIPDISYDSWVYDIIDQYRSVRPGLHMLGEDFKSYESYSKISPVYYTHSQFLKTNYVSNTRGGSCPLLGVIWPSHQSVVVVDYNTATNGDQSFADLYGEGTAESITAYNNYVQHIESQHGAVVINRGYNNDPIDVDIKLGHRRYNEVFKAFPAYAIYNAPLYHYITEAGQGTNPVNPQQNFWHGEYGTDYPPNVSFDMYDLYKWRLETHGKKIPSQDVSVYADNFNVYTTPRPGIAVINSIVWMLQSNVRFPSLSNEIDLYFSNYASDKSIAPPDFSGILWLDIEEYGPFWRVGNTSNTVYNNWKTAWERYTGTYVNYFDSSMTIYQRNPEYATEFLKDHPYFGGGNGWMNIQWTNVDIDDTKVGATVNDAPYDGPTGVLNNMICKFLRDTYIKYSSLWYKSIVEKVQACRPNCQVGLYNFPYGNLASTGSFSLSIFKKEFENQYLLDLLDVLDVFLPEFYIIDPETTVDYPHINYLYAGNSTPEYAAQSLRGRADRIIRKHDYIQSVNFIKSLSMSHNKKTYAVICPGIFPYGFAGTIVVSPTTDAINMIQYAYDAGLDGVLLWHNGDYYANTSFKTMVKSVWYPLLQSMYDKDIAMLSDNISIPNPPTNLIAYPANGYGQIFNTSGV